MPDVRGNHFKVEVKNGTLWETGIEAEHIDDITGAIRHGSYVESGAFKYLYKIDGGRFYTPAALGRIKKFNYARQVALQVNDTEEFLLIATTVRLLTKNASPAPFEFYKSESERGIQQLVTEGAYESAQQQN